MEILNSIDFIILGKDSKLILSSREKEPEKGKVALIGGMLDSFESFEAGCERILKKKLGLVARVVGSQIEISGLGTFPIKQFKTYDSGPDPRGGNTTVYVIDTNLDEKVLKGALHREFIFVDKDHVPPLAFEHNRFVSEYFFTEKNYSTAQVQDIGITVDIVILTVKDGLLKVLLSKRSKEPFEGAFVLPGGFVDAKLSLEENARSLLKRDTNIDGAYLEQLYTFGDVKRDSRGRIISVAYYALIDSSKQNLVYSQKYSQIDWFTLSDLKKIEIGFDHRKIIDFALKRIENKIEYSNIAFQLLPEKFTLAELQKVYETILDTTLDKRNFRKKLAELDIVEELDEYKKEGRMRPAKYHRFKDRDSESVFKAKRWV
ncbi:MAG: NrtR DNA-binding winged helix domain-containing protein [Nanoarchaeota archaeon]